MNQLTAQKLIDKTADDYNLIADQFASTRKFNWGDLAGALHTLKLKKHSKVLDLGCGNGRLYELLKDIDVEYYGLDLSKELLAYAKTNVPSGHFTIGDLLKTPYRENEFDAVISVATLHHIPSRELRLAALKEIYRITKPGGYVLITNWYFWNKKQYLKEITKTAVAKAFGKTKLDFGDFYMSWKNGKGDKLTQRYFHAWGKAEIRKLLQKANFTEIEADFFFKKNRKIGYNLIAICKKTSLNGEGLGPTFDRRA